MNNQQTYEIVVKLLNNFVLVLENWLDNPIDGNGLSLVKIVPIADCYGVAIFKDYGNDVLVNTPFSPLRSFFVCAIDGEFTLGVCDFDETHRTILKGRVENYRIELKGLCPPFGADDKYSFLTTDD